MASKVVLILGAGPNIGKALIQKFSSNGFKVAIASRTIAPDVAAAADSSTKVDFADPSSIKTVFDTTKSQVGVPNIVIYNAAGNHMNPTAFGVPITDFEQDLAVNTVSVYAAAQEAVKGFEGLAKEVKKAFIFTGNGLNTAVLPALLSMGIGKSATAHLIQGASVAFAEQNYRFYYADERKADGNFVGGAISGPNAADYYWTLAEKEEQEYWLATFVGSEYKKF